MFLLAKVQKGMHISIALGLKALEAKFSDHWSLHLEVFMAKRTDIGHSSILLFGMPELSALAW